MDVSACLVTRGNVDMTQILASLEDAGITDIVIWDNAKREDLRVYGRYAAIAEAKYDLIFVQDDDCIVSDPMQIVLAWEMVTGHAHWHAKFDEREVVVCNMPPEFRHDFYIDHALVGFGAVFHREASDRAFERFWGFQHIIGVDAYHLTCDIVFTGLTPRVLVDVPKENLSWANSADRMYRQREHQPMRSATLELVRKIKDETPHSLHHA